MNEGYYALLISILRHCTPEQAFELLNNGTRKRWCKGNKRIIRHMVKLKEQGKTYREIGEMYGISKDAAYQHIRRAKIREKNKNISSHSSKMATHVQIQSHPRS